MKRWLRRVVPDHLIHSVAAKLRGRKRRSITCNICGHSGKPVAFGGPLYPNTTCRRCGAVSRHRQLWLWYSQQESKLPSPILHFAAEKAISTHLRAAYPGEYRTADLFSLTVDVRLNLEQIDLPTASIGTVIANHVLEHVDDAKALREIHRVLMPGGLLICSVPIIESWAATYENPAITSADDREAHYGQYDHVRMYGRDFRERVERAGFRLDEEFIASPEACVELALVRGESVFIYRRP
ncbi:MAG TPA: methyltransferase domain-containing protein [Microbacteriaceae bacterium]|nr:methyltransferase domain-containing protein [Microbacteriaceae bacterium]